MEPVESRPFRLVRPGDPHRIVRGRVEGPRGFERAAHALPHVILLHGFKGFMDWGFFPEMARRIVARGMVAVRYNASGSGIGEDLATFSDPEAFARSTVTRDLEDLEAVREWIESGAVRGVDPDRVALLGHSRGGGVAIVHAAERADCRSVVTWAAIASFDRFDDETKRTWRARGHLPIHNARTGDLLRLDVGALDDLEQSRARLDVLAACRRVRARVLLVHGSADETVPRFEMDLLADALEPELRRTILVDGAGHTFGVGHPMSSADADATVWADVARTSLEWIESAWSP